MTADPWAAGWHDDVLGAPFSALTLPLGEDDEGPVVATLVTYRRGGPVGPHGDVLYVHGWSDYFFQQHLARHWHSRGWRFFALDLRKYGRSLRSGQTPGLVGSLDRYDDDIAAALEVIAGDHRPLVMMGHSTGGLTLSLWADRHPGRVAGLVLNSPWLELQVGGAGRAAIAPVARRQARRDPLRPLPRVDLGHYTRTVSRSFEGRWDYDLRWRPERGFVATSAWFAAVLAGQQRVAAGLDIDAPVLTLLSARSHLAARFSPEMTRTDVAIDVDLTALRATRLGGLVTVARLDGAVHDVFLSAAPVVRDADHVVDRWLRGFVEPSRV